MQAQVFATGACRVSGGRVLPCPHAAAAWKHPLQGKAAKCQSTQAKDLDAAHELCIAAEDRCRQLGGFEPVLQPRWRQNNLVDSRVD